MAGIKTVVAAMVAAALSLAVAAAGDEARMFADPPRSAGPWCYYFWLNANVDEETIDADIDAMARLGVGGILQLDPRGYWDDDDHVPNPPATCEWMSPRWRELVKRTVDACARHGMQYGMSVANGGGALKAAPMGADAPKQLVLKRMDVKGGTTFHGDLHDKPAEIYGDIAVFAVRVEGPLPEAVTGWVEGVSGVRAMEVTNSGTEEDTTKFAGKVAAEIRELTGLVKEDGSLDWSAPKGGDWMILRYCWTIIPGRACDVDVLDPGAVTKNFERMRPLLDLLKEHVGKTFQYFYCPSWEGAMPTWTPKFEENFRALNGYDLRGQLPIVSGLVPAHGGAAARARLMEDYRRSANLMFLKGCYETLGRLCHAEGLRWSSESGGPWKRTAPAFGMADQIAFLAATDIPQGECWTAMPWKADNQPRYHHRGAVSAARISGKPIAASECFTHMVRHWSMTPETLKPVADDAFLDGINRIVCHTFTASPKKFGLPGVEYFAGTHFNRNVTWFHLAGGFFDYLRRCQWMLQRGAPVAEYAVYTGDRPYQDWGAYRGFAYDGATVALDPAYDYDMLDTDALLGATRGTADGGLEIPSAGRHYRFLVVDLADEDISLASIRRLRDLAKAGVKIYLGKRRAVRATGLRPQDDAAVREAMAEIVRLGVADAQSVRVDRQAAGFAPDGGLEARHRREGTTDIYFMRATTGGRHTVRVWPGKRRAVLWNPVTGTCLPAACRPCGAGEVEIPFDAPAGGALFLTLEPGAAAAVPEAPAAEQRAVAAEGWEIAFVDGRGAPDKLRVTELFDWTGSADDAVKYYSGSAVYRTKFPWTGALDGWRLGLGKVGAVARVRLNGHDLGTVWCAPWEVSTDGALKDGENELEIEVVNTWVNRMVGDTFLPPDKRWCRSNVRVLAGKRGKANVYSCFAQDDGLMPSGLVGPVVMRRGGQGHHQTSNN